MHVLATIRALERAGKTELAEQLRSAACPVCKGDTPRGAISPAETCYSCKGHGIETEQERRQRHAHSKLRAIRDEVYRECGLSPNGTLLEDE